MNNQEKFIAQFKEQAREIIEEHSAAIKAKYNSESLANDVRLQVFNEHLSHLKNQLQDKLREITSQVNTGESPALQTKLMSSYNNYINEFYKMEF